VSGRDGLLALDVAQAIRTAAMIDGPTARRPDDPKRAAREPAGGPCGNLLGALIARAAVRVIADFLGRVGIGGGG